MGYPTIHIRRRPSARGRLKSIATIVGVLASLMATNVLLSAVVPAWAYIPAILVAAGLAVLVARRAGATLDDLGLAAHRARRSLLVGLGIGAVIVAIVLIGLTVPGIRDVFADERFADLGVGALAYQALVRIPLGTAVGEELLFRSVGLGVGLRRWSIAGGVAASSALFGLWHVLPALDSHASNSAAAGVPLPLLVVATVAITGLAGVGFSWLRLWTGHVAAPLVAHATLNASALVAAAAIAA